MSFGDIHTSETIQKKHLYTCSISAAAVLLGEVRRNEWNEVGDSAVFHKVVRQARIRADSWAGILKCGLCKLYKRKHFFIINILNLIF